jgi:hypothetical protein
VQQGFSQVALHAILSSPSFLQQALSQDLSQVFFLAQHAFSQSGSHFLPW